MAEIGFIKSIKLDAGNPVAEIETGSGVEVTGVVINPLGTEFWPIVGDTVLFVRAGGEILILCGLSLDCTGAPGEVSIYSRSSSGAITAQLWLRSGGAVTVEADGAVSVTSGGAVTVEADGAVSVTSGGAVTVEADGAVSVTSGGVFSVNGNFEVDP
jgi:hypothetical protein